MKYAFILLLMTAGSMLYGGFRLTQDGKAHANIVIPANAPEMVKYAANELADFVYRMSGAKLPVSTDKKAGNPIFIGFDTDKFEVDQLKIFCDGKSLMLTGGGEFGSLKAVYAFLRDQGIFWPYMAEIWLEIPQKKTIACPEINLVKKPHFPVRDLHNFPKDHARLFRWMAFSGWRYRSQNPPGTLQLSSMLSRGIRPSFGSHCWAFWATRKALNEHIEWNPLLNGKRTPPALSGPPWWSHSQLCIGNAGLRKHFINNMLAYMKKYPSARILPLEANDGGGYCECDLCQAYGKNGSDRVFRFVNEVAEVFRLKHPEVKLKVNAYGNHEDIPSFPVAKNVYIWVCYNERNYTRPITDPVNARFYRRLKEWAEACPGQIVARDMGVKVFFKDWPHPYDDVLAEDIKTYRKLKLAGFFNEGLFPTPLTEYLRINLAWDPDQDVKELTGKFCKGLYGAAAEPMYQYYRLMNERIAQTGKNLDTMTTIAEFTAPIAVKARNLLEQAEKAAASSPRHLARIRFEKDNFTKLAGSVNMWFSCDKDIINDTIRAANKLPNGSFENGMKDITCSTPQYSGCGKFKYSIVNDHVYHGRKAGCITIEKAGWGRMIMTAENLSPGKKYAIAAAVKSLDGADLMHIWYKNGKQRAIHYRLGDTRGKWSRFVAENITADSEGTIDVYLTIHNGPDSGKVIFDDVIIVEQEYLPCR
ncbi:MAG: DUF4838 domain-containing protein [Lentisphaeria bacterium]|nr:DUF4838 domain-containing protein [Lentisphaeria bacterium]